MNPISIFDKTGQQLNVGDLVANFGYTARIVEIKTASAIVVRGAGLDTSKAAMFGETWIANPAKCELANF